MKKLVYISGIGGSILFIVGVWALLFEIPTYLLFLIPGTFMIVACLVFTFLLKRDRERKLDNLIESHSGKAGEEESKIPEETPRGWGMNDSPFRDRKSGLEWNGGNVKGLTAKRGKRRQIFGRNK